MYSVFYQAYPHTSGAVLIADFNNTFFLKNSEVLKLAQKTKLSNAETRKLGNGQSRNEEFVEGLLAVDFNNRNEEAEYK